MLLNTRAAGKLVFVLLRGAFCIVLIMLTRALPAQDPDNGIHVANAKIYDARELTLMMDNLNKSLQGMNFINQNSLAGALGNVQGFQNTDTSAAVFANGAVGPQAAAVFANNLPASSANSASAASTAAAATTTTASPSPTVSININPAAPTASTTTASTSNSSPTGFGPSGSALPTLQNAPNFNPNFGLSSGDLLNSETNLTYQIFNLSMLLSRSLTDRIYHSDSPSQSRLQAVVGFDIDIEPDAHAKNAVAVVEITATMDSCPPAAEKPKPCPLDPNQHMATAPNKPEVVAIMPEQGSHNAATLTQKANSFGGALAAQVFSVGAGIQRRSQTFYLYRDIDTLSFVKPDPNPGVLRFGWQFRPVLGRPTVEAGLRHMMVVLSVPAADDEKPPNELLLRVEVKTHWVRYEGKTQSSGGFCILSCVQERAVTQAPIAVNVPKTLSYQNDLEPHVANVDWFPTDSTTGVAVVTGENFFPGTTVRLGNKTYTGNNDGLIIKSDKEFELTVPVSAAVAKGLVSGRYGDAQPLLNHDSVNYTRRFSLQSVKVYPEGPEAAQIVEKVVVYPPQASPEATISCSYSVAEQKSTPVDSFGQPIQVDRDGVPINLASLPRAKVEDFEPHFNHPILLLNGAPIAIVPTVLWNAASFVKNCDNGAPPGSLFIEITAIVPAKDVLKGSPVISVAFPFEGQDWLNPGIYYQRALNIIRAGSTTNAKLLITSNDPGDLLCKGWSVQLDQCEIPVTADGAAGPVCKAPVTPPATKVPPEKPARKTKRAPATPAGAGAAKPSNVPPIAPLLRCVNAGIDSQLSLDIDAKQLDSYKQLVLVHRDASTADILTNIVETRLGAIPETKPKPPAPVVTKTAPVSVQQYSSQTVELDGTSLGQIKTVMFDKTQLTIVNQDANTLLVDIPVSMTQKATTHDQLVLNSDQNDPITVNLDVTAAPAQAKKEK
jgi:hypothetical protein